MSIIGDRAAFPIPPGYNDRGMTYFQWLVGQALAGRAAADEAGVTYEDDAKIAIAQARAVIAELEKQDG